MGAAGAAGWARRVRGLRLYGSNGVDGHSDLALDLVAELFRRDDFGRFPELRAYFNPVPGDAAACAA